MCKFALSSAWNTERQMQPLTLFNKFQIWRFFLNATAGHRKCSGGPHAPRGPVLGPHWSNLYAVIGSVDGVRHGLYRWCCHLQRALSDLWPQAVLFDVARLGFLVGEWIVVGTISFKVERSRRSLFSLNDAEKVKLRTCSKVSDTDCVWIHCWFHALSIVAYCRGGSRGDDRHS